MKFIFLILLLTSASAFSQIETSGDRTHYSFRFNNTYSFKDNSKAGSGRVYFRGGKAYRGSPSSYISETTCEVSFRHEKVINNNKFNFTSTRMRLVHQGNSVNNDANLFQKFARFAYWQNGWPNDQRTVYFESFDGGSNRASMIVCYKPGNSSREAITISDIRRAFGANLSINRVEESRENASTYNGSRGSSEQRGSSRGSGRSDLRSGSTTRE